MNINRRQNGGCRIEIKRYDTSQADRWDSYVNSAPDATFCHRSGWLRAIENTWRHENYSLLAQREGRMAGILPLFMVRSLFFGKRLISTPNAVYGGVVAEDLTVRRALIEAAKGLAVELGADHVELRECSIVDDQAQRQNLYVRFECELMGDEMALMKSFPGDVRRMIRKGVKNGLSSETGREDLLDDFYEIYAASVRKLGTPVFPRTLFAEFLIQFPRESEIMIVRSGVRPVAAVLSFYFRDTVMPYYGGAHREYNRAGVNNFMYWDLMRRAARRGLTRFDFGRSKLGSGAYHFKRGWGMKERQLPYQFYLFGRHNLPELNPVNPRFKLMIEIWKRLPLGLTKLLGPRIVRNFP